MAKKSKPNPAEFEVINDEVERRLDRAKQEKMMVQDQIREAYSFVMPYRAKPQVMGEDTRPREEATDNFSSIGEEVATDFASDMADTFIPEHTQWATVEVAAVVPDMYRSDALAAVKADGDATFAAITASNFHETGKQAFKDLAVSYFGMSIVDPGFGMPIRCQAIPISEMFILRDCYGTIGTRIWVRELPCGEIQSLFPDVKLPDVVQRAIDGKKLHVKFRLMQGCYRDYSVRAETAWILFTKIADDVVEGARKIGEGAANILAGRWDPDPNFSPGIGCAIKALADFRENDELNYLKLKGLARIIDPPVAYDDDQVMNLDGGLPNGVAIPRLKGSKIEVIESQHDMQSSLYAVKDVEDRIRRHFYQDPPMQKGLTPPTLGQWADESLQKQRRLGTPAAPLWQEFIQEAYMRFRWLLVVRGSLQPQVKIGNDMFPVRPVNPLKNAANQQKAVASERFLATVQSIFGPNLISTIVDVGKTVTDMKDLSGADGVTLQPAAQINDALQKNQQAILQQNAVATAAPLLKSAQQ